MIGRYGKICKKWGEANAIAIRIARAFSGREKVAHVVSWLA